MTDEQHKWERSHVKNRDIEYGLFSNDEVVFTSNSKPEIMIEAEKRNYLKDSYKDPFDFITAPHLKEAITIKARALKPVWREVGADESKGIKCLELITSEQF